MGSIAINENVFRSHWLCKNSCCTLATMARPPFWFLTSPAINGQGKYRIVPESISVYSYLLQSVYIIQTQWSTVCVSRCARNADTTGGVGKLRGVRGCARGTAPPAGEPSGLGGALRMRPSTAQLRAQGFTVRAFAEKYISFNLSGSEFWKYFLTFSFHLFIYRNIICSGLSQHNKSMARRGITWLYQFQKQKVILRTMNLYILENLKCQSSWFTYSVSKVTHSLKSTLRI